MLKTKLTSMMCSNCSWSRLAILCSLSDSLSPHELAVIRWCFIVGHVLLAAIFKRIMGGIILCNGFDCKLFYGLFPVCTCQLICLIILDAFKKHPMAVWLSLQAMLLSFAVMN